MSRQEAPPVHGGRLAALRRRFPDAPAPFLDLSTGINPYPYPAPPLADDHLTRLPEPEALATLEVAAARAYGLSRGGEAIAAAGSQALIGLLPLLWPPRAVAVLAPTYAEHAFVWRQAGHRVHEVTTLADAKAADIVVLCNPNNPDGRVIAPAELRAFAAALAARGGWLVVDEAFADFAPDGVSLAPSLPERGVVVLRSFGKASGLAGLRLGFALAPAALAPRLRAALGPWPVSGAAITIGTTMFDDAGWRAAMAARLAGEAASLDALLSAAGLTVRGGTALFRLAESADAASVFHRLGAAGILVRRFAAHPRWLRFGLPGAGWARLIAAISRPSGHVEK
jgi:cobalamin biosynthetic protein CobC